MADVYPLYPSFYYTITQETQASASFVTKNWTLDGDGDDGEWGGDDDNDDDDEWIKLYKASIYWCPHILRYISSSVDEELNNSKSS